jgi:NAD(P)-dependent dehydrogenase (short-subunit alcohol dehydrogenase family)
MTELIAGTTAFITGGAQGIGLGIARALAKRGIAVALADVNAHALALAKAQLDGMTQVETYVLDVRDRAAFAEVANSAESSLGPVSLLFNNAGVTAMSPIEGMTYASWDWQLQLNLGGVVNGVQTFLPRMLERKRPAHIVNTSSGAGLVGYGSGYLYATAKFAIVGLTESLSPELAQRGIGISVLCPGPVDTQIITNSAEIQRADRGDDAPEIPAEALAAKSAFLAQGVSTLEVGEMVARGIERGQLYILTDDLMHDAVMTRASLIQAAGPTRTQAPSPEDVPEKFELGTEEWVRAYAGLYDEALVNVDLSGVNFSVCEEYLTPPPDLLADGRTSLGYIWRIADGDFRMEAAVAEDVDVKISADWELIRRMATLRYAIPEELEEFQRLAQQAMAEGWLRVVGDPASKPAALAQVDLHDKLAARTVRPPSHHGATQQPDGKKV